MRCATERLQVSLSRRVLKVVRPGVASGDRIGLWETGRGECSRSRVCDMTIVNVMAGTIIYIYMSNWVRGSGHHHHHHPFRMTFAGVVSELTQIAVLINIIWLAIIRRHNSGATSTRYTRPNALRCATPARVSLTLQPGKKTSGSNSD